MSSQTTHALTGVCLSAFVSSVLFSGLFFFQLLLQRAVFFLAALTAFVFVLSVYLWCWKWYWENLKDDYAKKQRTCHHWCVGLQVWPGFCFAFPSFVCAMCAGRATAALTLHYITLLSGVFFSALSQP